MIGRDSLLRCWRGLGSPKRVCFRLRRVCFLLRASKFLVTTVLGNGCLFLRSGAYGSIVCEIWLAISLRRTLNRMSIPRLRTARDLQISRSLSQHLLRPKFRIEDIANDRFWPKTEMVRSSAILSATDPLQPVTSEASLGQELPHSVCIVCSRPQDQVLVLVTA